METVSIGIAGEFRCVVTKADGSIKTDTGYQRNLILNQGLDFFGGGKGSAINTNCVIGSGNSSPSATQTTLDAFIAISKATSSGSTSDYSYINKGDNKYTAWEQGFYRFIGLSGVNVSEVGLASEGTSSANYYLTTRALIKDSLGEPTSISVIAGETLDIYYKIYRVIDTSDKTHTINMINGAGVTTPYNVVVRPSNIGSPYNKKLLEPLSVTRYIDVSTNDLAAITSQPAGASRVEPAVTLASYTTGSYKLVMTIKFGLNLANINIRSISAHNGNLSLPFYFFQMRFGRVSDDFPIPKTDKETLTIPLEFSWGRYEGAL